jgi:peroxiredoxin
MTRGLAVTITATTLALLAASVLTAGPGGSGPETPRELRADTTGGTGPVTTTGRPGASAVNDAIGELHLVRPGRSPKVEDFTVKMMAGPSFRLADHLGRVVLVNFWATWCPPCREEMPAMERLYRQHRDRGFVVLAVSVDADPSVVPAYIKDNGFTFLVGSDPEMSLAGAYGVRALPSSFVVDRQGRVAAMAVGPRAWDSRAAHALVEGLTR